MTFGGWAPDDRFATFPRMPVPAFPRRPFAFSYACVALAPLAARLAGVVEHGWGWVWSYLPVALMCAPLALAPAITVTGLGQAQRARPVAFWTALAVALAVLLLAHSALPVPRGDNPRIAMAWMTTAVIATFAAAIAWGATLLAVRLLRRP